MEIRQITRDEVGAFRAAISRGFGNDLDSRQLGPEADQAWLAIFPLDTALAAFEGGAIVATFGSFDHELIVPGGTVPLAGTTTVTVHPTHRRRGLLTAMMARHLAQVRDRGQPLAGLWASEETIYGRFGYGQATPSLELSIPPGLQVPPGPDDLALRFLSTDEARRLLPPVYDRVRPLVPGYLARLAPWWDERHLNDYEWHRDGSSALRIVMAERAGAGVGYVLFRQKFTWDHGPAGETEIEELVAVDDDARRGLWQFITHVDLYPRVSWWSCPIDEPVLEEVDGPARWAPACATPCGSAARRAGRPGSPALRARRRADPGRGRRCRVRHRHLASRGRRGPSHLPPVVG